MNRFKKGDLVVVKGLKGTWTFVEYGYTYSNGTQSSSDRVTVYKKDSGVGDRQNVYWDSVMLLSLLHPENV